MTIKGRQLFVGNLPYVVGWQDLKDLFRKAGSVQRANIILSRDGRSKGHGIVLYATVADAQKAISEFDGYEWHGRKLEVREDRSAMDFPPPPPRTEGVNNINQNEENDKITSTNGLTVSANSNDINVTSSSTTTSPVDYSITNNEILNVNGTTNINGTTNGVTTYSEEHTVNNSNNTSSTLQRQLFVGNLPFRVRWQDLKDLFREAGTVIRADVAMGYDNRSKGHGTVLFATLEEAKNAIAMFNQKNWQGRILEVREDRGFVDPNIQNNINGHPYHHHQHHSQDHSRRVIDHTNHSHTQTPYGPGGPMIGLFYGPRVQAPQPNYAGRLLFVGNLPFNCQWQDLKDLFRNAGNIIRADVSTNFDGRSRGFGTVLFATPEDARNAVGMYNGYEFQGRTLRVHFDKFSLPPLPPHHHNPPPHPAHLPPPVHPHHRPPPLISNIPHHNFHLGPPPPIPHHFMPPAHMGPFSPPLTTPSLTSPPPFPVSYNPLAHLNNHPNANTNASSPFQPIQPIPIVSSAGSIHGIGTNSQQTSTQSSQSVQDQPIVTPATQFPGFGPIGKTHHSPQSTVTSSLSNLGAVGIFPGSSSNTSNGIANNNGINGTTDGNNINYNSGNDNTIHSLTSTFASLHLSPLGQAPQLFYNFHPHPHHRHPVIPTAYHPHHHHQVAAAAAAHHHQQHHHHHSHSQHPHHHHPGAIGSGIGGINAHVHSQANGISDPPVSVTTTSASNGLGSSSTTTEATNNSVNNSNNSSNSSVPTSIVVPSPGLWDNSTSTMLSTATAVSNGPNGTANSGSVISIGMTSSLTGMGGLDSPTVPLYL
ncbi:hypothetical protein C1645_707212 [Glomus cerebriforme]|uniref:RRM domain-containing protein n=1 Tax=Glomus cerebriforme TaxID=658196 RepID=A0A397TJ10_9GLOM|nr:hypothetical protein C1645_707212 [Glomus cerebriforme]